LRLLGYGRRHDPADRGGGMSRIRYAVWQWDDPMNNFWRHAWFGVCVVGGLLAINWNGALGCGVMIVGLILFGLPILIEDLRGEGGYWQTRQEADYDLRAITGDLTPAEMKDVEAVERKTFNDNYDAIAFWTGADGYCDYDGNWVQK